MGSLADYFSNHRPKPIWSIGDRVFGRWNKIPFIGTVGNDHMVSESVGPVVIIFLDLPIRYKEKIYRMITVKQKDIKKLVKL